MEYLKEYNKFTRTIVYTSIQNRDITVEIEGSRIKSIENNSGIRFPFQEGQMFNRSVEVWATNNNFKIDGETMATPGSDKIFGIKKKDIPQGHPLRTAYPGKFR